MLVNFSILKNPHIYFNIGIFLLLSAPFLACLFFIFSILIISFTKKNNFLKNKFNYPLFLCSLLLFLSTLLHTTIFKSKLVGWDPYLSWIGLANWVPLFYCYWIFQQLLKTPESREKAIKLFLVGSIPLFLSGFTQIWLDWHGPFSFLNNFC